MELVLRFDYGASVPWVRRVDDALIAIAGPNAVRIDTPVELRGVDLRPWGRSPSRRATASRSSSCGTPRTCRPRSRWTRRRRSSARRSTGSSGRGGCGYDGAWAEPVRSSIRTLKALTYEPTGGIVAAPTTSLPEWIGSVRNWDYRYCWLRDATLTIVTLIDAGYLEEARAWRNWLFRAAAGDPADLQIMYGVAGERRLPEFEIDSLPGFEGSRPVRVGNAASEQVQLDVYGEVIDAFYTGRLHGLEASDHAWQLSRHLLGFLESAWQRPDAGIWEVRGPNRHFTHSKVMAWVAFDRAVLTAETWDRPGPVDRWRAVRDEIHADVCAKGYDPELGAFTQFYGSQRLDASDCSSRSSGFLPPDDHRVIGTVEAVGRTLERDGLIARYEADEENAEVDGLPPGEGVFLPCSFWYAANLALIGRTDEAHALFTRLLGLRNDLGLLSEEYDPAAGRMLGNFPQAFTHLSLVMCAYVLDQGKRARRLAVPEVVRPRKRRLHLGEAGDLAGERAE